MSRLKPLLLLPLFAAPTAQAAVTFTVTESAGTVSVVGQGTLDLTGLSPSRMLDLDFRGINPSNTFINIGGASGGRGMAKPSHG